MADIPIWVADSRRREARERLAAIFNADGPTTDDWILALEEFIDLIIETHRD